MNKWFKAELNRLSADFAETVGSTFEHFFCPVLYQDEEAKLCRAHVINEAFDNSSRACTIQRSDIDNFYGSRFEADFVDIAKFKKISLTEILADPALAKRFNAKVLLNGNQVEHFYPSGQVPKQFSRVQVGNLDPALPFGLKMDSSEVMNAACQNWEIDVSRDVTLQMLVSTIKAAHLSLFKMLGYRYVFTTAGYFVGRMMLGEFFLRNAKVRKRDIEARAIEFFASNVHMVRPVISTTFGAEGTITDRKMFMCMGGSGAPWAFIVLVRTGDQMHGVMIPTYQTVDQIDTFIGFTRNSNTSIQVATCSFEGDKWEISEGTMPMTWPKDGCLLSTHTRRVA
jgi:hypothetical protein